MVGYVVVPGIGGSDDTHWQTLWEREWAATAVRIEPASWSEPELDDWIDAIDRAVAEVPERNGDVVLVAHSLGCWAAAEWLVRAPRPTVSAALFVAPPDLAADAFPSGAASSFTALVAHRLPCASTVVASTNDPYGALDVVEGLANAWGSRVHIVEAAGHLNAASGLGVWPEGRQVLEAMVRPSSSRVMNVDSGSGA